MSTSGSRSLNKALQNDNPLTPLSPFPSTPRRLSYIDTANYNIYNASNEDHLTTTNNNGNNDYYHFNSPQLTEHLSPTKALAATRLNHEIATLTSWLEGLFAPDAVPPPFLRWRDEVLAAASSSQGGGVGVVVGIGIDGALGRGYSGGHDSVPQTPTGFRAGRGHSYAQEREIGRSGNVPATGTGNDVLEALNALKQTNLAADHLAALVHEARSEELRDLRGTEEKVKRQRDGGVRARLLLDEIYQRLSPKAVDALASLNESAVMLGLDLDHHAGTSDAIHGDSGSANLMSIFSHAILEQANRNLIADEQLHALTNLQDQISSQQHKIQSNAATLHSTHHEDTTQANPRTTTSPSPSPTPETPNLATSTLTRDTKHLHLKLMEYTDRTVALQRQVSTARSRSNISLSDILAARTRVEERKTRVKGLQERFAGFNGLPPDLEDSRNEVRRAVGELEALKRRRGELFERMGRG